MRYVIPCLLVAACDAGSKPTPPAPAAVARADAALATVHALDAGAIDAPQWPPHELDRLLAMPRAMVTGDGQFVLFAVGEDTGARGDPTLAFEVHDRHDRLIGKRITVLGLDEAIDDPTRPARIAEAERLIASHPFVAMTALPRAELVPDDEHYAEHEQFADTGTVVEWRNTTIEVTYKDKPVVVRPVDGSWYVPSYYLKGEDLTCSNPPFLGGAYVGPPTAKLVVIDVGYRGNDTCWEPIAKPHVIAW